MSAAFTTQANRHRVNAADLATGLCFLTALLVALLVEHRTLDILLVVVVFVPLERLFELRPQPALRRALVCDLTHFLLNTVLTTAGTIAIIVVAGLPFVWIRSLDLAGRLPGAVALSIAMASLFLGVYWGHRLMHRVSFLWRFHAVHHSAELMDWAVSRRLHPIDASLTQAFALFPLYVLGYEWGAFAAVGPFIGVLAVLEHANIRLRFPGLRCLISTPEYHHWHHARDCGGDKNFGLPIIDRIFGTAYLPKGERPADFGISDPVPREGYLQHLAYPFTAAARGQRGSG